MKILVVGSGGREHALVWKISQSKRVKEIYCAPGNGGISKLAKCVHIKATDVEGIVNFSKENHIDMVVVAPDDPLVMGMVDALETAGIRAFGPNKNAAIIEGSKAFAKDLMKKYNIPTATYEVFDKSDNAIEYLKHQQYPIVIKADGLALGKGVIIAQNFSEAEAAVKNIMEDKVFGESGKTIIVEEFLVGQEVSVLSFTDGNTIVPMKSVQDHKRVFDNDEGLNTGGMGTFTPSRIYNDEVANICMEKIFKPTIIAMQKEGRKFKGVLYFGIIMTKNGPKVLEYNARFGDPETQVLMPILKIDIIDIFDACIDGKLDKLKIEWENNAAVCVMLASGGYPQKYSTGYEISGIKSFDGKSDTILFHSGTKLENDKYFTNGGRVIGVTALEADIDKAIQKAYMSVEKISFKDMHFRRDIGRK